MDDDNWDLHAVVRSCSKATTAFSHLGERGGGGGGDPAPCSSPSPSPHPHPPGNTLASQPPFGELQEICRPFFHGPSPLNVELRPPSLLGRFQQQQQQEQRPLSHAAARPKRRKNQVKKVVCHVPADGVCSDVWAWRKYGQKPIKGSPFPRGYYRCSSSKGCPAKKLVERSRTDPSTFVVTYTGEHNHAAPAHRSCLAGSTRSSKSAPLPLPPLPREPEAQQHQQQQKAQERKDSSSSSNGASDAAVTVEEEVPMMGALRGEELEDDDGVCCSASGGVIEFGGCYSC